MFENQNSNIIIIFPHFTEREKRAVKTSTGTNVVVVSTYNTGGKIAEGQWIVPKPPNDDDIDDGDKQEESNSEADGKKVPKSDVSHLMGWCRENVNNKVFNITNVN